MIFMLDKINEYQKGSGKMKEIRNTPTLPGVERPFEKAQSERIFDRTSEVAPEANDKALSTNRSDSFNNIGSNIEEILVYMSLEVPDDDIAAPSLIRNISQHIFGTDEKGTEFKSSLNKLIDSCELTEETDGNGRTLFENLLDMSQQKFTPELDGEKIMDLTIKHLARPEEIRNRKQASCAAAVLQYIQAEDQPADYARTVAGLTSTDGKVDLGYGDVLEANEDSLRKDRSLRDDVCRIYQASAIDYANGDLEYSNSEQKHIDPNDPDFQKGKGITSSEYTRVSNIILPYNVENKRVKDISTKDEDIGKREIIENDIQSFIDEGNLVAAGMRWSQVSDDKYRLHKLAITNIDGDYIYLRNPNGDAETGSKPDDRKPEREAILDENGNSGGHIKMKKEIFFDRLVSYHVPE
jgi:hypothetical protein